ncbi:hypothetical protein SAMN04488542_1714 [Fontibacillus panacisegetis]|uniref:Uncharacterized protein n=1 Tax=Fontibacillus panacisegetis TaxID=670482 RepID=A0A1G7VIS8_9BACL|nr:hypothetical protein [Fontibacillus panacisegetis]SDG59742.1 hypothetical protein SAMN04488542_1714 [Fontibacillus panacisegetis]
MSLYEECLSKLGEQALVLSEEQTNQLFDELQESFLFTFYGRIDWKKTNLKKTQFDISKEKFENITAYILWDNNLFSAIESELSIIINSIADVLKVSFDTWIYVPGKFVIEFYHDGEVTIGYCY